MAVAAFAIASRAADLLVDLHGRVYGSSVLLLVGPGSNGGDALYAGAQLAKRGAQVQAWLSSQRFHEDGMRTFLAAGGRCIADIPDRAELVIDGIVGMGSRGALDALPELPDSFVVAIDLPSGVDPDTGHISGPHIAADLTLATGAYKAAHFIDPAHEACGVVEFINLDLPFASTDKYLCQSWQGSDVADLLNSIEIDSVRVDKYRRGVLGLCAGSQTYPGAAGLCVEGALGAGVGMIRSYSGAVEGYPEIVTAQGQVQALVIGPGLTDYATAIELLERQIPAIVDAGAIAHCSPARPLTVLTPHAGELARYLDVDRVWIEEHRLQAAVNAAEKSQMIVLLKGSTTLIAAPDGRVAINPTGTAALATAGSGDVLAGIVGALMARGAEPFQAAVAGAYIHGIAGSFAEVGASAIAAMVPAAISSIRQY